MIKNVRDSGLQDYVTAIRKQERELLTERFEVKKRKLAHLRRKNEFLTDDEEEDTVQKIRKLSGEIIDSGGGLSPTITKMAWKILSRTERKIQFLGFQDQGIPKICQVVNAVTKANPHY